MRWYDGFSVLENDGPHCSRPGMQGPGLWPLASVQVVVALADPAIASVATRAAARSSISCQAQGQQQTRPGCSLAKLDRTTRL